ncbi:hypothetical protein BKA62DRAFT_703013 [Auriculariales sp. MPI-PUGE-AT-0066]|nr:hypothetical protein BKA62DRAFT_703013 [Auriculariales sp. MPI-PUGE-AT-0066]
MSAGDTVSLSRITRCQLPLEILFLVIELSCRDGTSQMLSLTHVSKAVRNSANTFLYRVVELHSFRSTALFDQNMRLHLGMHPGMALLRSLDCQIASILCQCTGLESFFSTICVQWGPVEPPCLVVPPWPLPATSSVVRIRHTQRDPSRSARRVVLTDGTLLGYTHRGMGTYRHTDHSLWAWVTHLAIEPRRTSNSYLKDILSMQTFERLVLLVCMRSVADETDGEPEGSQVADALIAESRRMSIPREETWMLDINSWDEKLRRKTFIYDCRGRLNAANSGSLTGIRYHLWRQHVVDCSAGSALKQIFEDATPYDSCISRNH